MKLEIWSDVVCPWCYVGKRNFETALARFPHAAEVDVVWRSYELDPSAPREREGDYETRLSRKYGTSVDQARAMIARVVDAGAGAGLDMRFDRQRPGNTFDAHRLLHLAGEHGLQNEVKERFLAATFTEGEPIGDPETLARLAIDAGLPSDDVDAVLASDRYADGVRADEAEASAIGVNGVPFFVAD
ncbi:MAG TPA: DsbA family oxidoreductase, partial [Acidimicrobiales bacterium]|nr:DsbA family oxidoreductase [Acidimicrobiales bacterium]